MICELYCTNHSSNHCLQYNSFNFRTITHPTIRFSLFISTNKTGITNKFYETLVVENLIVARFKKRKFQTL